MELLAREGFSRVTLDCDGSVTGRHAEGTATGFNRKRKGARSCHPLFRTIVRTDQVPDVRHRPGNVRDSNGADTFIGHRMSQVRPRLPHAKIETRIDSAFLDETVVQQLHSSGAEFTISVPFEHFLALKSLIEGEKRWCRPADGTDRFETRWKPKSWNARHRFIPVGKRVRHQHKQPIQFDLFRLVEYGCEFKAIATKKRTDPRDIAAFHEAGGRRRASSPNPRRIAKWIACRPGSGPETNRTCSPASLPTTSPANCGSKSTAAHAVRPQKRAALRCFREMEILRRTPVRRTGRMIRPGGKLLLSMNSEDSLEGEIRHDVTALNAAA